MVKISDKTMANTIADKLTYLSGTKDAIKQAIIGKGVEITDSDTFRSYADKIEAIQAGGGGTVNIPDGTKFGQSKYTTVPDSIIPYLESQTDMNSMFSYCEKLQTVPLFDTSNVNDMYYMFYDCKVLETVPQFNTVNVTNMGYMFMSCSKLTTAPQFNTVNVTNMGYMFENCHSLTTVPQFNTVNVTIMSSMFSSCSELTTVPQFDTSNVTTMSSMFSGCRKLTTVPLFNASKLTTDWWMFNNCTSLTNLGGFTGLKIGLEFKSSSLLTADSIMNVINYAEDMTSSPKTLTLHQDAFNRLTEEQIATATAKGWNIASR